MASALSLASFPRCRFGSPANRHWPVTRCLSKVLSRCSVMRAAQLLGLVMEAKRGEMVVDFCAGAGGKTLLLWRADAQYRPAVCL